VERNPRGWEIGTVEVELTAAGREDPLFAGLPRRLRVQSTHEDHVAELPADAPLLAGNPRTPVQAFGWRDRLRAVQFHPEASAGIIRALIGLRRAVLEADAMVQGRPDAGAARRQVAALEAGATETDHGRRLLANWVASWVRGGA
jgi:GMP synthase (glutamine-hydrolysing)